jgi:hypothetical protein
MENGELYPRAQRVEDSVEQTQSTDFSKEKVYFKQILEMSVAENYIIGYRLEFSERLSTLRLLLGGECPPHSSRTHKRLPNGAWVGIQVESESKEKQVGIDLEHAAPENYDWTRYDHLRVQLGLLPKINPRELISHWCARESIYKATSRFRFRDWNREADEDLELNVLDFQFLERQGADLKGFPVELLSFSQKTSFGLKTYQSRVFWFGDWIFSMACEKNKTPANEKH